MKISKENIEVILFDYAEGNLSNQERKEVEAFLEKNPHYKQMLSSYQECEKLSKPLNIVFEDEDILVINKPEGMVVHPAPGNLSGYICLVRNVAAIND